LKISFLKNMRRVIVKDYIYGQIDTIEARTIPRGACSDGLNWQTKGDKIELVRGYSSLGNESATVKKMTGVYVATQNDGTEIAFRTYGKKLEYLDEDTDTWTEIGTDILGTAADGKDISFAEYQSLAGDQLWVNSPYGPLIKIMLANPGSHTVMYDSTKNHKGYIKIKQGRMFLWGKLSDKTGLYLSHIDKQLLSDYTSIADENVGTGDGSTKTFTDTLAFRAAGAKRTCFGIAVTDGTETFTDNYDGTLTGDAEGTGTINYTTGAISITFNAAPANSQAITCDYYWEDSTSDGIADFTQSATRVAGEGELFRQDDGGVIQSVESYGDEEYCIHKKKTWVLKLTDDDTNATNQIYRDKVGIPYWRASVATGDGIYLIDDSDKSDPQLRLLTVPYLMEKVIPISISKQLKYKNINVGVDLSPFRFNKAVGIEWGDYIIFAFRTTDSTENDRLLVYNKKQKTIDILERYATELAVYNGTLIASDPSVQTVYTLFSGWDDADQATINNKWEGNEDSLDFNGLKKCKRIIIKGEIQTEQELEVSTSVDNGDFALAGTIEGDGDYVDSGQEISVGANTIGSREVGGGGAGEVAYKFETNIDLALDKFETIKIKFEATKLGYVSVSEIWFDDIRLKQQKIPLSYRQ